MVFFGVAFAAPDKEGGIPAWARAISPGSADDMSSASAPVSDASSV